MLRLIFAMMMVYFVSGCVIYKPRTNPLAPAYVETLKIKQVQINTSKAFFGGGAEAFKERLEPELKAAILSEFAERRSDTGLNLGVRVTRVQVSDSGSTAILGEFSTLEGVVFLFDQDGKEIAKYQVTSRSGAKGNDLLTAAVIAAAQNRESYYTSLVERFASRTFESITE